MRTDGWTIGVKIVITIGHDFGSAEWIKKKREIYVRVTFYIHHLKSNIPRIYLRG